MRIKILHSLSSPHFHYHVGQIVQHEDQEALRLIASGAAEACPDPVIDAQAAIERLGLDYGELDGKSPAEQLMALASAAVAEDDSPPIPDLDNLLLAALGRSGSLIPGTEVAFQPAVETPEDDQADEIAAPDAPETADSPDEAETRAEKATGRKKAKAKAAK